MVLRGIADGIQTTLPASDDPGAAIIAVWEAVAPDLARHAGARWQPPGGAQNQARPALDSGLREVVESIQGPPVSL